MSSIPKDATIVNLGGAFSSGNPALLVTATSSGGAHTLHTATSGTDDADVLHLWASNVDASAAVVLSIEIGAVTMQVSVQRLAAPIKVLDGIALNNGIVVKAYAASASDIVLMAKVIRMVRATS